MEEAQFAKDLVKKLNDFKKAAKFIFKEVWMPNIHLGPFLDCSDYSNFYDENVAIEGLLFCKRSSNY